MKKTCVMLILVFVLVPLLFSQRIDFYKKPKQFERSRDYDAIHYRIKISLDIENKSFQGETVITLSPLKDGFQKCVLDAEDFTVTSILSQWGSPLKFEQIDKKLIVHLWRSFSYGEPLSFTAFYRCQNPKRGLQFYEESEETPAMVASNSWPDGVHHWFPCFDFPNDKVTNEIIATVESGNKVCANGRLVSVTDDTAAGTTTYHWSQELPHSTYLIFMAAAPYIIVRDSYGTLPVNYWVYPQHEKYARLTYGKTPKMIEFFNTTFGYEYPWAKYDQVSTPFGGGAESTSATAMGHRIIHDERAEQDYSSIGIVSHELAHQWWGNLITLRTWAHAWMNEGFGTYSDYLYARYELGEDEGAVNLLGKKNGYLREANNRYLRPVVIDHYDRQGDLFDTHSYRKGACVLHMMRFMAGDKLFFKTLSHFLHEYAFDVVDTHDFMRTVKTVTGQNLDWFFEQWIFKPGHPIFDIGYTWDEGDGKVRLKVTQTQDTSQGIPIFRTPVLIAIITPKGKVTQKVWIEDREEEFTFDAAEKPLLVRFDEGNHLVKEWTFRKSREELVYQMKNDDVIGRMWAAAELIRFKDDPDTVTALADSARTDEFWAVRRSAVETLGKMKDPAHIDLFKEKSRDESSKVRIAALAALGDLGRPSLVGFFKKRFQQDDSYYAQAEALRSLGKTGNKTLIPFLKKAMEMPSYRNVIKNAAERVLKAFQE